MSQLLDIRKVTHDDVVTVDVFDPIAGKGKVFAFTHDQYKSMIDSIVSNGDIPEFPEGDDLDAEIDRLLGEEELITRDDADELRDKIRDLEDELWEERAGRARAESRIDDLISVVVNMADPLR